MTSKRASIKRILSILLILLLIFTAVPAFGQKVSSSTSIKIGDYVQFGHYNEEPIVWRIINIDKDGDPLLFSEDIISLKAYDAASPGTYEQYYREEQGINLWRDSNIRQWLNSSDETVNWKDGVPSTENLMRRANPYDKEKGFLAGDNFSVQERAAIKQVTHKALLSYYDKGLNEGGTYISLDFRDISSIGDAYDKAYYNSVSDEVFLLSVKDLHEYVYKRGYEVKAKPTQKAIDKSLVKFDGLSSEKYWDYWLSTPDDGYNAYTKGGYSNYIDNEHPYADYVGVRPALYIDLSSLSFKSGDGSKDFPYKQYQIGIRMNRKSVPIELGHGEILSYSFLPEHETDKAIWSSKDSSIATVDEKGYVKALKLGTTTISVKTTSGVTDTCEIIVVPSSNANSTVGKKVLTAKGLRRSTVDENDSYINSWDELSGGTSEFFDDKGRFNVVYEANDKLYIVTLDENMKVFKTLEINKELPLFGAAAHEDGYYYFLWGKDNAEEDKQSKNIVITKYDSKGNKTASAEYASGDINVKEPFKAGNAIIICSDGIVAAYFARRMYQSSDGLNHQASQAVYADANTMKPLELPRPYSSHSFDQQVIATSDGELLFVDKGDAFERGFLISELDKIDMNARVSTIVPFHFREGTTYRYQWVFAQLGGIAEGDKGYALVGSSEKTLSGAPAMAERNESRNLFIQILKKDLNGLSIYKDISMEDYIISKGEQRILKGDSGDSPGRYFLSQGIVNYGVKWLTDYTGTADVANPKLVATDDGRFVVLWEHFDNQRFVDSYYMILSAYGEVLQPATLMKDTRLSYSERPVYNSGKVYWTVSFKKDDIIECYTLDVSRKITAVSAIPSKSNVLINGKKVAFEAYNIGGSNYFKLRDLAQAIGSTSKRFEVGWDGAKNAISMTTGKKYTAVGGELKISGDTDIKSAASTTSQIYLNSEEVIFAAYNIGGNNYFKLRDIAAALDFEVTWDSSTNTIGINTSAGYIAP